MLNEKNLLTVQFIKRILKMSFLQAQKEVHRGWSMLQKQNKIQSWHKTALYDVKKGMCNC